MINIQGNYKEFESLNPKLRGILKEEDEGVIFQSIFYNSLKELYFDLKRNPDKKFHYKEVFGISLKEIFKLLEEELNINTTERGF